MPPSLCQVDVLVFSHLLAGRFPGLARHLAALEVDAASVSMSWFLCAFLNALPLDSTLRGARLRARSWAGVAGQEGALAARQPQRRHHHAARANPTAHTPHPTPPAPGSRRRSLGPALLRAQPCGAVPRRAGAGGGLRARAGLHARVERRLHAAAVLRPDDVRLQVGAGRGRVGQGLGCRLAGAAPGPAKRPSPGPRRAPAGLLSPPLPPPPASRLVDTASCGYAHLRDAGLRVLRQRYLPAVLDNLRVRCRGRGGRWDVSGPAFFSLRSPTAVAALTQQPCPNAPGPLLPLRPPTARARSHLRPSTRRLWPASRRSRRPPRHRAQAATSRKPTSVPAQRCARRRRRRRQRGSVRLTAGT